MSENSEFGIGEMVKVHLEVFLNYCLLKPFERKNSGYTRDEEFINGVLKRDRERAC